MPHEKELYIDKRREKKLMNVLSIFELIKSDPTKRQPYSIRKNNVLVEKFDPLIVWWFEKSIWEIGFRGHYGLRFTWGYGMGDWSRIKRKYIKIGKLIISLESWRLAYIPCQ